MKSLKSLKLYPLLFLALFLLINIPVHADVTSDLDYETELSKFPSDYQELLKELHEDHPNWIFVAYDTGLDWDDVIAGESKGDTSLIRNYYSTLLLSKDAEDYDASTGQYIIYDGTTSVNANDAAIAYFVDPRNYLTEKNIFAMELLSYDSSSHTLDAVEAILSGTDLADKIITYTDTEGNTVELEMTYGEAILAAGAEYDVSPLMLASRIRQETGGSLSNNSICGTYEYNGVSYQGYYNFFNIKAYSSSTGAAVANGLSYAQGSGDYGRPWNTPVKAIFGGAEYLATGYINIGQNTNYFQKFDVINKPYYSHQYMQTIYAVMSESASTYSAYNNYGMLDDTIVFSIPVYDNMPSQTGTLTISKGVSTGTTTTSSNLNMRSGPSTSYSTVTSIPSGATVTVSGGIFTDKTQIVSNKLNNPYWFKVTYGGKTGYVAATYIKMDTAFTINAGSTQNLSLSKSLSGEKVYYQSGNPAIATVNSSGVITGVGTGECNIYAYSSSGQLIDAVGIAVTGTTEEPEEKLDAPELISAVNEKDGVSITWNSVSEASGYDIYRKDSSNTAWTKIGTVTSADTVEYLDTTVVSGTTYTYTVCAYNDELTSEYESSTGVTTVYLSEPALSVSSTSDSVTISWTEVTGAKGYYIYMMNSSGQWTQVGDVTNGSAVSFTKPDLTASTSYTFTVKAYYDSYYSTCSSGITATTTEPTYTTYKTTTGVNYRTGAGTSYQKAGSLTKGTKIEVEDGFSVEANGYTWYRFKLNSKTYYIVSQYLTKVTDGTTDDTTTTVTYTKYKTTTNVNYRTGAGTSYTKKGTLTKGTVIEVEDGYSKTANGYTWYRFKYNSGTYYIASTYLTKVTDTTDSDTSDDTTTVTYTKYKTTTGVNYRTGAGTSYTKKGTLTKGTVIEVEDGYSKTANGYTWYRFKYNSGTYYIASTYLTKVTDTTDSDTSDDTTTVTYTRYKTTTGVNYRSGAGTSYAKKGTLSAGTVIQVENGYSKTANGYTWYRFKYGSGTYYIASEYLKKVQ